MKALTLEILRGGFLPPNAFSPLLKAICIIASRQGVKYFLKTQLCFCRLILNRKKAHSPECTENTVLRPGTMWEYLAVVGQPTCEGVAACGSRQEVSKVRPLHLKSVCEKHTLHKTDVKFAAAFISLSTPLIHMSSQFVHLYCKACIHPA